MTTPPSSREKILDGVGAAAVATMAVVVVTLGKTVIDDAFAVSALVVAAWQLNPLALTLSPVVLAILFFYSYTKRFTRWSHLVLGSAIAMAPVAAWVAWRTCLSLLHQV